MLDELPAGFGVWHHSFMRFQFVWFIGLFVCRFVWLFFESLNQVFSVDYYPISRFALCVKIKTIVQMCVCVCARTHKICKIAMIRHVFKF